MIRKKKESYNFPVVWTSGKGLYTFKTFPENHIWQFARDMLFRIHSNKRREPWNLNGFKRNYSLTATPFLTLMLKKWNAFKVEEPHSTPAIPSVTLIPSFPSVSASTPITSPATAKPSCRGRTYFGPCCSYVLLYFLRNHKNKNTRYLCLKRTIILITAPNREVLIIIHFCITQICIIVISSLFTVTHFCLIHLCITVKSPDIKRWIPFCSQK